MKRLNNKQIRVIILIAIVAIIICGFLGSCWIAPLLIQSPREKMQEDLANELNIKIQDYLPSYSFPVGYFHAVLHSGMHIQDVHEIVKGYQKVLHCDMYSEIYYYFSTDDDEAERIEVFYDEDGFYQWLEGEDSNSRTIRTDGCEPGLLISP